METFEASATVIATLLTRKVQCACCRLHCGARGACPSSYYRALTDDVWFTPSLAVTTVCSMTDVRSYVSTPELLTVLDVCCCLSMPEF